MRALVIYFVDNLEPLLNTHFHANELRFEETLWKMGNIYTISKAVDGLYVHFRMCVSSFHRIYVLDRVCIKISLFCIMNTHTTHIKLSFSSRISE